MAALSLVQRARPIVAIVDALAVAEDLLVVLVLLDLLLVLVHGRLLRHFLAGVLRRVGIRPGALREVIHRISSLLAGPVAVLVVLIVVRVAVEVVLLLQVARRIRTGLHVACDVAGLRSGLVLRSKVLSAALLIRAVL